MLGPQNRDLAEWIAVAIPAYIEAIDSVRNEAGVKFEDANDYVAYMRGKLIAEQHSLPHLAGDALVQAQAKIDLLSNILIPQIRTSTLSGVKTTLTVCRLAFLEILAKYNEIDASA